MVPVDDTALAVTDTGGPGIPVVYLNGQFATRGYWRRVVADLGAGWRHLTYDERARGRKSKCSADYSFEAAVGDVDAVLAARGVDRVLVVGWSYGAFVGAHWVTRNPARAVGAVLVDGAQPYDWLTAQMELGIRKMFRRMGWFMPYVLASGASFGSKGDEQEVIRAGLDPVFERKPNIQLSAKVASNHGAILRKDYPAIAEAVREVAATRDREGG